MKQGFLTEYKLIAILLEKGFQVSIPCDPNCHYDLIVDLNGFFKRVQVKSCNTLKRNRYRVDIACGAQNKKRPYSANSLGFFIAYISKENAWYIIPFGIVAGQKWISVYPHDKAGKYEMYRDNWGLLS